MGGWGGLRGIDILKRKLVDCTRLLITIYIYIYLYISAEKITLRFFKEKKSFFCILNINNCLTNIIHVNQCFTSHDTFTITCINHNKKCNLNFYCCTFWFTERWVWEKNSIHVLTAHPWNGELIRMKSNWWCQRIPNNNTYH